MVYTGLPGKPGFPCNSYRAIDEWRSSSILKIINFKKEVGI